MPTTSTRPATERHATIAEVLDKPATTPTPLAPKRKNYARQMRKRKAALVKIAAGIVRPSTKWMQKIRCRGRSRTAFLRRVANKTSRKKVRGASKKEQYRLDKLERRKGKRFFKKEPPPYRSVVYATDVEKLMQLDTHRHNAI